MKEMKMSGTTEARVFLEKCEGESHLTVHVGKMTFGFNYTDDRVFFGVSANGVDIRDDQWEAEYVETDALFAPDNFKGDDKKDKEEGADKE